MYNLIVIVDCIGFYVIKLIYSVIMDMNKDIGRCLLLYEFILFICI